MPHLILSECLHFSLPFHRCVHCFVSALSYCAHYFCIKLKLRGLNTQKMFCIWYPWMCCALSLLRCEESEMLKAERETDRERERERAGCVSSEEAPSVRNMSRNDVPLTDVSRPQEADVAEARSPHPAGFLFP